MKKTRRILALLMVFLMTTALALSACGSKEEPDDGQNPVMNFIGYYVCDRANVFIDTDGDEGASAIVTWNSSAWENSTWVMSGTFDSETLQFEYHDCVRTDYEYEENGDVKSQEEVYTGGHGFMTFSDGTPLTLTWQDDQENIADGMVFEYAGADEGTMETGMPNPWTTVGSAAEAAEGAGLDLFMVPDGEAEISLGLLKVDQYRCMDGMAEAVVEYPAVEMVIRKGRADLAMTPEDTQASCGDISGDYNEYANTWTQNIKGLEVQCFGNREGDATKTVWQVEDMCWSIVVEGLGGDTDYGLSPDDLNSLINGIQ